MNGVRLLISENFKEESSYIHNNAIIKIEKVTCLQVQITGDEGSRKF